LRVRRRVHVPLDRAADSECLHSDPADAGRDGHTFLREVPGKPILSPVVFKALPDRFVAAVHAFTAAHDIPVLPATGRTKPGAVAQRALHAAARADRWGVVAVVVHQESARVFTSRHAGGRRTNFWVREERRLVNHYYFYLRDREYGDGFVRIGSYAPFQMRIWLKQDTKGGRVLRTGVCSVFLGRACRPPIKPRPRGGAAPAAVRAAAQGA
jgi:hypothetical protein